MKTLSIKDFPHKLLIKLQIRALRNGRTASDEAILLIAQALVSTSTSRVPKLTRRCAIEPT
jgi:plasmid stability protein